MGETVSKGEKNLEKLIIFNCDIHDVVLHLSKLKRIEIYQCNLKSSNIIII